MHNHHNYALRGEHFGRTYWVVRKGCTPAQPGREGFVGASMGGDSVILEGVESPEAKDALNSAVHGAGRVMSRTEAAGKVSAVTRYPCGVRATAPGNSGKEYKDERCPQHPDAEVHKHRTEELVRPGRVDWDAVRAGPREQGVVLIGGGADEAPEDYERLPDVLPAHAGSIRVRHTLRPLGVAMAGRGIFEPYKD